MITSVRSLESYHNSYLQRQLAMKNVSFQAVCLQHGTCQQTEELVRMRTLSRETRYWKIRYSGHLLFPPTQIHLSTSSLAVCVIHALAESLFRVFEVDLCLFASCSKLFSFAKSSDDVSILCLAIDSSSIGGKLVTGGPLTFLFLLCVR